MNVPVSLFRDLKKLADRLAGPTLMFWILPFMMILLVIGTIAQKEIGLYAAQREFFGSFVVFLGPIPFPAGLTLMGLFLINLLAKFLFRSTWSWQKSGTIISHFGVLILVAGGAVTAFDSQEGFLTIEEGRSSSTIEDYHARDLVITHISADGKDKSVLFTLPHTSLREGLRLAPDAIKPVSLRIDRYCYNCAIERRPEESQDGWERPGKFMMLVPVPADPQDEKNMAGIEFTALAQGRHDTKHLTFDGFPKPPVIPAPDTKGGYQVTIERAKRPLPFSVTLESFDRDVHPGTDMAKSYASRVVVTDAKNGLSFPAIIEMNEPLRYRGYTLYQSSFDESGERPFTVLTVVKNRGRIFPYIASLLIAVGLLIHLGVRYTARGQKSTREGMA